MEKTREELKLEKKMNLIRNEFKRSGKYDFPWIKKEEFDLDAIDLISYCKTKKDDRENDYKTVQFFTYDWLFDNVYDKPQETVEKLKQYYALLTPDFSMYTNMPLAQQIHSTFKSRWCGAFWQSLGMRVIPTIEWGDERSFEFCFDGIEIGSVVAIATYHRKNKEGFLKGYNKMLEIIKPSGIICFDKPFPEMRGNIKFIDAFENQNFPLT